MSSCQVQRVYTVEGTIQTKRHKVQIYENGAIYNTLERITMQKCEQYTLAFILPEEYV